MGQSRDILALALTAMGEIPGVRVEKASGLYVTEPQGDSEQPWFINQAAELACAPEVTPLGLLDRLLGIETDLGRQRDPSRRDGPRNIDLDLLLFGDSVIKSRRLILPHPRMLKRAFVLVPLLEICPDITLPDGARAADALESLTYRVEGKRIYQS